MEDKKPILLVEDDLVDQMSVKRALKDLNITNTLEITNNGEEALEFLRDEKNKKPGLILLDLNMPKMNGVEFLEIIKQDIVLKRIPVVVLTTSKMEQDKINCYNLGVAGYMIKSVDYQKFVEVMNTIHIYWSLSELPEEEK